MPSKSKRVSQTSEEPHHRGRRRTANEVNNIDGNEQEEPVLDTKQQSIVSSKTTNLEVAKDVEAIPSSGKACVESSPANHEDATQQKVTKEAKRKRSVTTEVNHAEEEDERAACCLCHCALDYSDRSAFFEGDRRKEFDDQQSCGESSDSDPLYYQLTDPYLPIDLYDSHNALVYCDGCNRLYHQKCHFVPVLTLPRGSWYCLVCSTTTKKLTKQKNSRKRKGKNTVESKLSFTELQLKSMFQSPPMHSTNSESEFHSSDELAWEHVERNAKVDLWYRTLTHILPQSIQSQLGNLRQAGTTLETLTTTKRNRVHFTKKGSQELAQAIVRLTSAKLKLRNIVLSLDQYRTNPEFHWLILQQWLNHTSDLVDSSNRETLPPSKHFVERVIFPFGQFGHRIIPRTDEMKEDKKHDIILSVDKNDANDEVAVKGKNEAIPTEIVMKRAQSPKSYKTNLVCQDASMNEKMETKESPYKGRPKSSKPEVIKSGFKREKKGQENESHDNNSGVSLDNLRCCICFVGDATDENDLILCDGQGCYRAYHLQCLHSKSISKEELEKEDEDWFCPLCVGVATSLHTIQSFVAGEEWEYHRNHEIRYASINNNNEEDVSMKSWEKPSDVFPQASWENETALQLKSGTKNEKTDLLLKIILGDDDGEEIDDAIEMESTGSDNVEIDGHFDLENFQEERRKMYEEMVSEDSDSDDHSSQATLVEMSSVELQIGKSELAALRANTDAASNEPSDSDDNSILAESDNSREMKRRRSRRIRLRSKNSEPIAKNDIGGANLDSKNILPGKRRRKAVDYRRLNDALFGELNEKEVAEIDDKEDFIAAPPARKREEASSDGLSSAEDDDDSKSVSSNENDEGLSGKLKQQQNGQNKVLHES